MILKMRSTFLYQNHVILRNFIEHHFQFFEKPLSHVPRFPSEIRVSPLSASDKFISEC